MTPARSFGPMIVCAGLALGSVLAASGTASAQDAEAGAKIFKTQCAVCHSPLQGKNVIGPSLFGVVGRTSGQVAGFKYSAANEKAHLTWDAATLNTYLTSPKAVVPGTIMTYVGLKNEKQRADLIAYLGTLK